MCDGIRKRPAAGFSPISLALQRGGRLRTSCVDDAKNSRSTISDAARIFIDLESHTGVVDSAGSSSAYHIERINDERERIEISEGCRSHVESAPGEIAEMCSPTQAWSQSDVRREAKDECLSQCAKHEWSPHRLRSYCEKLVEPHDDREKHEWSPHRLRSYCEKVNRL